MEMQIMNCNGLSALQSCLGYKSKNTYKASTDCAELLQEIVGILTADSDKLKSRQVLSTLNIIGNDLVPLLKSTKDLESFQYAIELLRRLTDPVESLVIHDGKPLEGGLGLDINNIYIQSRAYCLDHDLLSSLVKMINTTMKEDVAFYRDEEIVQMINNCFLFLKNLLHMTTTCEKSMRWQRTKLMKMIFETRLSDVLLNILKIDDSCKFSSSGSQVIALLFKDANDLFIKKVPYWIINDDCDVDDNDDDEDDDDGNDDGVYDMRILDDTLTVKSFNSEDCILSEISSQLQKFADKLIDESFGLLVKGLLTESMSQSNVDDTYFLWIVSYFTKYISCRFDEVPSHLFECLMSVKLCSALIYQGVGMCESLMALQLTNCWNVTYQRKLHLAVTCLSHIFKICKDLECDDSDLNLFQCELSGMKSLQGLFLLLLNQFKPHVQGLLYLSDLIQANHHYLILMNKWQKQGYLPSDFDFKTFIAGYANQPLMNTFSYSLANFENNPSDLNISILTLMHHIVGDVGKIEALLQLPIIIIFGQIWEKSFCPDFSDLIETVLTTFLKFSSGDPDSMANQLFDSGVKETERSEMVTEKEEEDRWEDEDLVFSYLASDENCTVSDIVDHLKEYNIDKTAVQVAKLLSTTGMVSDKMLSEIQFILLEENGGNKDKSVLKLDDSMEMDDVILMEAVDKTIKLIDTERLTWLQTRLIDAAKAKAYIQDEYGSIPDSIPLCCQALKKSTPLTLFTAKEENYFKDDNFVLLLELMEFKMAATHIEVYPRIPYDWTVSVILKKSEKLGEIDPEDVEYLSMYTEDMEMEGLTALQDLNLLSKHPAPSQHQIKPRVLNHGRGEEVSWLDYVKQMNKM